MSESSNGITVRVAVDSDALRRDLTELVLRYSEWLDSEGLLVEPDEDDDRNHDELVADFFESK